ncbi:SapB/AmfS family lanthipeptide [Actinophytocola xanthii]|nr:SapB/AmfS family lanthipeptide [Actinophytocola xanthii]
MNHILDLQALDDSSETHPEAPSVFSSASAGLCISCLSLTVCG